MKSETHEHHHTPNRFGVVPTDIRLKAHPLFTGRGITIAFLDSGFYPHPDLIEPNNRIVAYEDLTGEYSDLNDIKPSQGWQWHGTQTSVAAAGNGYLSSGVYRGLASDAELVLVKVSHSGRITEDNIARGIRWVIDNKQRYNIRVLNISLGGDEDVPCSKSIIDQAAEEAVRLGLVIVVAAGNSGHEGKHSIPPANSPSVITVGGYSDNNRLDRSKLDLYQSNFGFTADGTLKPEVIAPAMWIAAPILPSTADYRRAEALSRLAAAPDYELSSLARELMTDAEIPDSLLATSQQTVRSFIESMLKERKIVATHYQHVDGTSFAAPIVSAIVAQMLEANPDLSPATIKDILISTAERIVEHSNLRQGYGVVNARHAVDAAITEKHSLEGRSVSIERDSLWFTYHDDSADTVSLAGDFNNWDTAKTLLQRQESGLWSVQIPRPKPGRYHYKFVVNDQLWFEDPRNWRKVEDNFGGLNSVLVVE
jgi:serine protease AprX